MSILSIRGGTTSRTSPALGSVFFILALLVFTALPTGAEELEPARNKVKDPHPVHPRFELSNTALDFAETPPGGSAELTVTVTNNGPGTIPLKMRITLGDEVFGLTGPGGKHHLRPGDSVDIGVMFSPPERRRQACGPNCGPEGSQGGCCRRRCR